MPARWPRRSGYAAWYVLPVHAALTVIRELLALALFASVYVELAVFLRARAGRTLGSLVPLAAVAFIGTEAVIVNVLSLAHGVRLAPVAAVHLALVAGLAWATPRGSHIALARLCVFRLRGVRVVWALAPLGAYLLVTVLVYPPTNWDSMTYHMARVAYWWQARSVGYYATGQPAQNIMGPGAEYLLLLLQTLSGGDRWSNLVQLLAVVVAVASLPTLCRLCGMPKRLAPWAAVFVAGMPLVALEGTTTQNDLVAAVTTLAIVAATLPFFSRSTRWRPLDWALLAASVACSYLVKPTASLAALPMLVGAVVCALVVVVRTRRPILRGVAIAIATGAAVVGPDLARKVASTRSAFGGRNEIYPVLGAWADRLFNGVRSYGQHALVPKWTDAHLQAVQLKLFGSPAPLYTGWVYASNEDRSGNPLHATMCVLLAVLLVVPCATWALRRARGFGLFIASTVPAAWFVQHGFLRNQEFLTRLELPVFVLTPLLFVPFVARGALAAPFFRGAVRCVAVVGLASGFLAATTNPFRPLSVPFVLDPPPRAFLYYTTRPQVRDANEHALERIRRSGCRRVALYIDSQAYDYPLAWRAMQEGIEVHRYVEPSAWACLVYSELGRPPEDPQVGFDDLGGGFYSPVGHQRP